MVGLTWIEAVALGIPTSVGMGPVLSADATLAKRLKAWREYRGFATQLALERKATLPHGVVVRLESGETTNPQLKTLVKLAKALGITVSELVGQ